MKLFAYQRQRRWQTLSVLCLYWFCFPLSAVAADPDAAAETPKNHVVLHSDHILRAQLTPALEDKSPTGEIGPVIPMNERGLIRVYLFTELQDLQGRRVYYDWYRQGERQARVTVRPEARQMRASTSKFIDRNMLGEWEVRVLLADETLLMKADFYVEPSNN